MAMKSEIVDAMDGMDAGSPPAVFTQSGTISQMDACGCRWPEANFDIDKMIELALQMSRQYGFDTVRIPFDLTAEAEGLGATVLPGNGRMQPMVSGSPWRGADLSEPPELPPMDEFLSGRCSMHVEAGRRLSRDHPELFLTAGIFGPMGVVGHLMGMEEMMIASITEPDTVKRWTEAVLPYQCEYARMLSEVCDNVMMITGGSEDIMPPSTFDDFVAPFDGKVFSCIRESFSLAHCCGQTGHVLRRLASLGETALSVCSFGDPEYIAREVGGRAVLAGGVPAVETLMLRGPEDVISDARRAADAGYGVITPECGVPPLTSDANLLALARYREHNIVNYE